MELLKELIATGAITLEDIQLYLNSINNNYSEYHPLAGWRYYTILETRFISAKTNGVWWWVT